MVRLKDESPVLMSYIETTQHQETICHEYFDSKDTYSIKALVQSLLRIKTVYYKINCKIFNYSAGSNEGVEMDSNSSLSPAIQSQLITHYESWCSVGE